MGKYTCKNVDILIREIQHEMNVMIAYKIESKLIEGEQKKYDTYERYRRLHSQSALRLEKNLKELFKLNCKCR
jgi:hypothetical protein